MSKKLLILIIVLAGLALAGIIYVQLYYIKIAFEQNEIHFDQKVNDALLTFVDKLEQKETVEIIHEQIKKNAIKPSKHKILKSKNGKDKTFVFEFNDSLVHNLVLTSESENITVFDQRSDSNAINKQNKKRKFTTSVTTITHKNGKKIINQSWTSNDDTLINLNNNGVASHFEYKSDSNQVFVVKKDKIKEKTNKIKGLIQKMEDETKQQVIFFRKELDNKLIDSLLQISLIEKDINLHFEYKVLSNAKSKLPKSTGFDSTNTQKKYQTGLFPNDIIPKSDKLVLYFPGRKDHLMKSLSILLPSSLFFSLIVIVAFSISIMMVIRQKKISDIKSDFINNMTHEFKTPIATISLAADSIINPKVIDDHSKIEHFTRIIKEENKRMNLQVERILQMSLLDKREMDLNLILLDIHEIIEKAIEKMAMQISKYNGIISHDFMASNSLVQIDEIHFVNVIHNLIDNALKYSLGIPEIKISTHQVNHGILISVEDKGIGLSKEAQSKVFDKFYRVSKGNIHNIKGFGLGLSYVKAIVEALGGRIGVKSETNKGSRFDIFLPQKQKENGKFE
jgi:two-component system, OmpR family, phosphate regulon sensor histidine kinase PhoR